MVREETFGILLDGREVKKYSLKNDSIQVGVLTYGGIINEILVKDADDTFENVVLGFNDIKSYEMQNSFLGCIAGRVAGRISKGKINLNNVEYDLDKNEGSNTLHGGNHGLNKVLWKCEIIDDNSIMLSYTSPNLECGFPAEVVFNVKYSIDKSSLKIEYTGFPDSDTIITLTNHSYFNLSGNAKRDIVDNILQIDSDEVVILDNQCIPVQVKNVIGTIFDTQKCIKLQDVFNSKEEQITMVGGGYDHPFKLKGNINLVDPISKRTLKIITDEPAVVVYTGNKLDTEASLQQRAKKYNGICLETQDFPDSFNSELFESKIYNKNNIFKSKTEYKFGIY